MTCQDLEDALVDLARGTAPGPGSVAAVESHVEVLRQLRGATPHESGSSRLVCVRSRASTTGDVGSPRSRAAVDARVRGVAPGAGMEPRQRRTRGWLAAAAAAVVLAGAGAVAWRCSVDPSLPCPHPTVLPGLRPPFRHPHRAAARNPPPRGSQSGCRNARRDAAAGRQQAAGSATEAGDRRFGAGDHGRFRRASNSGGASRARERTHHSHRFAGGVAAGVWRRVVPDARRPEVEADLLVGQDGQPRAIRLVTTVSNSRSRE